jgi:hypothetical protein
VESISELRRESSIRGSSGRNKFVEALERGSASYHHPAMRMKEDQEDEEYNEKFSKYTYIKRTSRKCYFGNED